MNKLSAFVLSLAITCLVVACGGGGGGGSSMPPPVTVVNTVVTWGADNRTKTTTITYSDGSTSSTAVDVPPVESGAVLSTASGVNTTSPLINTFGNGVVEVLQDGSASKPFSQTTLAGKSIADPNGQVTSPTRAFDLRWGVKAAPYVLPTTDNVQAQFLSTQVSLQLDSTVTGFHYPLITQPSNINTTAPLDQSTSLMQGIWITPDVKAAWSQGWTGAGVKIGVIDDFTLNSSSEFLRLGMPTGCYTAPVAGVNVNFCSNTAGVALRLTHGEQVALIAGGSKSALTGLLFEGGAFAAPGDAGVYSAAADLTINLSSPMWGVAKDAEVLRNDFLTYQSATNGLFSELQRWGVGTDTSSQKYRELKVVNLSLGGTSQNPVFNTATYETQLAYATASVVPDAVFVKAAGNSSCVVSQTNCDPLNAVFYFAGPFKNKSLLVGALDQAGGSIAGYSNRAGTFSDRFVVADGRGIQRPDGTYDLGTSFAAPRVAGYAAIIRQKFPNLDAVSTSTVILDTATWNSSWGAKDAANQAIYGQGEANLGRALAPVGKLR